MMFYNHERADHTGVTLPLNSIFILQFCHCTNTHELQFLEFQDKVRQLVVKVQLCALAFLERPYVSLYAVLQKHNDELFIMKTYKSFRKARKLTT